MDITTPIYMYITKFDWNNYVPYSLIILRQKIFELKKCLESAKIYHENNEIWLNSENFHP